MKQRVKQDLQTPDACFEITYVDIDLDVITISSEVEFQEALDSVDVPIKFIVGVRK